MARQPLWDFFDGEPFMENPHLGVLSLGGTMNPRRKKRHHRRKTTVHPTLHRRGRKHTVRRRRRARRNWASAGMVIPVNRPKRRRHRRNPVARSGRRRSYRSNPGFMGIQIPTLKTVAFGTVGFVGPSFVSGFLNSMVPSVVTQINALGLPGKYIMKGVSIFGLAWLTKRFIGVQESHAVVVGGAMNIGLSLVNDLAPGILPANPLAMYIPNRPGMHAYTPVRPGLKNGNVPGTALPARNVVPMIPKAAPFTPEHGYARSTFGTPLRYQRY